MDESEKNEKPDWSEIREKEEIKILEERLDGLPVEYQRAYMRGYLDSMIYYLGYSEIKDGEGAIGIGLICETIVYRSIVDKLRELKMGREADALERGYKNTRKTVKRLNSFIEAIKE